MTPSLSLLAANCILAQLRQRRNFKSASFGRGDCLLRVTNGRNPVARIKGAFTPISLTLGEDGVNAVVFSGLNTGGKSVAMKTAGLLALMAQAGMPVPADVYMDEGMFSGYFKPTVYGSDISSEGGSSQFQAELEKVEWVYEEAGERSLVIIDDDIFGVIIMNFEKITLVHDGMNYFLHVIRFVRILRDHVI